MATRGEGGGGRLYYLATKKGIGGWFCGQQKRHRRSGECRGDALFV